jgi:hypothetical protein
MNRAVTEYIHPQINTAYYGSFIQTNLKPNDSSFEDKHFRTQQINITCRSLYYLLEYGVK